MEKGIPDEEFDVEKQTEQEDTGAGGPGSGPQTGTGGRSQDSSSGVSPQEAAENISPGREDSGASSTGGADE